MDITAATRLLRVLGTRPDVAMTCREIEVRWREVGGDPVSYRTIQRYMEKFSRDSADGPAIVEIIETSRTFKFYLKPLQVANWFMTEEAALNLQLTRQMLDQSFGKQDKLNTDKLADIAEQVINTSVETRRIRGLLRMVPDGIGRLPAKIDPAVLKVAIDAIGQSKKLKISYINALDKASDKLLSPMGLVAKDGTIYLLACKGLADLPRHYALHRIQDAELHYQKSQVDPNFDIDRYILESHQFSHTLDKDAPPEILKLRVAPVAMFHFRERPLSKEQSISDSPESDGWHLVAATVPITVLLCPFLISMGPWIEVLEPPSVRAAVAKSLRQAKELYDERD
jgi:predicted DNA-binding transcriptional regulator YafY